MKLTLILLLGLSLVPFQVIAMEQPDQNDNRTTNYAGPVRKTHYTLDFEKDMNDEEIDTLIKEMESSSCERRIKLTNIRIRSNICVLPHDLQFYKFFSYYTWAIEYWGTPYYRSHAEEYYSSAGHKLLRAIVRGKVEQIDFYARPEYDGTVENRYGLCYFDDFMKCIQSNVVHCYYEDGKEKFFLSVYHKDAYQKFFPVNIESPFNFLSLPEPVDLPPPPTPHQLPIKVKIKDMLQEDEALKRQAIHEHHNEKLQPKKKKSPPPQIKSRSKKVTPPDTENSGDSEDDLEGPARTFFFQNG